MRKAVPFAFVALALAGCNLAPPHVRPPLSTATDYPAAFAADPTPGRPAVEIGWNDFFADPRLAALVSQALARNRDLAVSIAQIEEARATYRVQRADRLPAITGTADASRSRTPGDQSLTGSPFTANSYSVGIGATAFELDFWGRVRNLTESARRQYLATVEAERAYRLTLIRDVATYYFAWCEYGEQIAVAESTVKSRQEDMRLARLRLDAGTISALDSSQTESLLKQAQADLASMRLSQAQSANYLAILTGGPVTDPLPDPLPLERQAQAPALTAGLPSDLLLARPDILEAEENLRAARANIGAARAAFFPTISLTGALGFASADIGNLFKDRAFTWNVGPSLSLPIFNYGKNRSNLDVAKARETIQVATYERTVQGAFREVADALAGRKYYAEQIVVQIDNVAAQQRIAQLARLRYQEGVDDYLQVLDAERNLFSTQQLLIQLRSDQAENLVTLYVALGGGLKK